jgi:hypothetical protein
VQLAHEGTRLFREPAVGEITAQEEHVGLRGDPVQERLQRALSGFGEMEIADRGDP